MTAWSRIRERSCVIRLEINGKDYTERANAIILSLRPFILLVPAHAILELEEGTAEFLSIGGTKYSPAEVDILASSVLCREHLAALKLTKLKRRGYFRVRLPVRPIRLNIDDEIRVDISASESVRGIATSLISKAGDDVIVTDIPVAPGYSGSPLFRRNKLAGVIIGRQTEQSAPSAESGHGIAIPIDKECLFDLKRLRSRIVPSFILRSFVLCLIAAVLMSAVATYSWLTFRTESVIISEDGTSISTHNGNRLTLHPEWTRVFEGRVKNVLPFTKQVDGSRKVVAVGTWFKEGINGAVHLLDERGRSLWSYSIPDGECVYDTQTASYTGFSAIRLLEYDLTGNGENELIAAFAHHTWFPCKLMVFSLNGEILAEYWHDGYIRTLFAAEVPGRDDPMLVVSASNNRLNEEVTWHVQTIFAFEWPDISGQCPPYNGSCEQGTELWYLQIENVDPTLVRAKCVSFELIDFDNDGVPEIRASLTDGRFYYLDSFGNVTGTDLADRFKADFGPIEPPPLLPIPLRLPQAASVLGAGGDYEECPPDLETLIHPIRIADYPSPPDKLLVIDGFSQGAFPNSVDWAIVADGDDLDRASLVQGSRGEITVRGYGESGEQAALLRFRDLFNASRYAGLECAIRSEYDCSVRVELLCVDPSLPGSSLSERTRVCGTKPFALPTSPESRRYQIPFFCFSGTTVLGSQSTSPRPELVRKSILGVRIAPDCLDHAVTIEQVGFFQN